MNQLVLQPPRLVGIYVSSREVRLAILSFSRKPVKCLACLVAFHDQSMVSAHTVSRTVRGSMLRVFGSSHSSCPDDTSEDRKPGSLTLRLHFVLDRDGGEREKRTLRKRNAVIT